MIARLFLSLLLIFGTSPGGAQTALFSGASVPPAAVIPAANNLATNWQNAGLASIGGIPTRSTQCGSTVTPSGLTPPTAGDDFSKVTAAIAACTAGQVVLLGSGTFNVAQSQLPIVLNKGITIRGSGSTVGTCNAATGTPCWPTVLQTYDGPQPTYNATPQCGVTISPTTNCPNGSGFFLVGPEGLFQYGWAGFPPGSTNPTTAGAGTLLAADVAQGATTVQVASTTNFTVGSYALIDESPQLTSQTNPISGQANISATADLLTSGPSPVVMRAEVTDAGNCTYTFCVNRVNEEIHKITAIGAGPCPGTSCTITFDDPLTMAYRQSGSHDGRAYWPTINNTTTPIAFLAQASIENLTITRANGGGINFQFCAQCWASNVEVNYWIGGGVNFNYSWKPYLAHSYLHNCIDCQNNGNEYPLGMSAATTGCLVEDNIITFGGKGMVGRAANTCVVAYNYVDKIFYEQAVIGDWFVDMGVNGSHYAGTHGFLFEDNWGPNCDNDETHGSASYHVYFRNHCTAMRSTFVDPSNGLTVNDCAGIGFAAPSNTPQAPGPLRAAGPMAFNYWDAFVSNVLGIAGMQSCAGGSFVYGANAAGATANRTIWHTGWTGSEWGTNPDPNLDGVSNTWIFRNGNYDYVNASVVDNAAGFAHTFPNSLYLPSSGASPPSWWPSGSTTYPYPQVTPLSSPFVQINSLGGSGLPAKARADAGTPFVQP